MAQKVGELEAELLLEIAQFVRESKKARNETKKTGKSFVSVGKVIKTVVTGVIIREVARMAISFVKAAADVEETLNLIGEVFGDQAEEAVKFADTLADELGRSRIAVRKTIGSLQAMLGPLIGNSEESAKMSKRFAQLSIDLGSFFNVADVDALTALRSGITGELEPLKKFGIVMTQAALDAFALTQGLGKTTRQMTEIEKATLRYNFILAKTVAAQGDAARTAGSLSNRIKKLEGLMSDLQATLGQIIAPAALEFVEAINTAAVFWRDILESQGKSATKTRELTSIEKDIVRELEKRIKLLKLSVREGRNFSSDAAMVLGINLRSLSVEQRSLLLAKQETQLAAILADAESMGLDRAKEVAKLKEIARKEAERQLMIAGQLASQERERVRQAALLTAQMLVLSGNILRAVDPTGKLSNEFLATRAEADDLISSIDALGDVGPKSMDKIRAEAAAAQMTIDAARSAALELKAALDSGAISGELFSDSIAKLKDVFSEASVAVTALQAETQQAMMVAQDQATALQAETQQAMMVAQDQARITEERFRQTAETISDAFGTAFASIGAGANSAEDAFKAFAKTAINVAIDAAKRIIIAHAAEAAAGAASSQAGIPIIGPALAPVAALALLGFVRGFLAQLQTGGEIKGIGSRDSKIAALSPGEVVVRAPLVQDLEALLSTQTGFPMIPAGVGAADGQAPITINLKVETITPLTDSEVDNLISRKIFPAIRRGRARGAI